MPALTKHRYEPFAEALSRDLSPFAAAKEAGFKGNKTQSCERALRPEVMERAAELRRRRDWGGTRDVAPLINELGAAVQEARKLDTAAAFVAVRGLIIEAARLKRMLPAPEVPWPRPMTVAEWEEKHGLKKSAETAPPV
jgi:hypothetical protein